MALFVAEESGVGNLVPETSSPRTRLLGDSVEKRGTRTRSENETL